MSIPASLPELTDLFANLGAKDAESWARSQLVEGIPQLHRYLFLRECWRMAVGDNETSWVDRQISQAQEDPKGPYAGVGTALGRAVSLGVSKQDLAQLARGAQIEFLTRLCYMLDDNGLTEPELQGVGWGLFQTNEEGDAIAPIYSLHESVLGLDPTGREMRPKVD